MFDILRKYAIDNVWCNPEQDNQLIFDARKISSPYGELNSVRVTGRRIDLPIKGKNYHVFQIGQIHPTVLGLLDIETRWIQEKWTSFSEAMSANNLIVTLYTKDGVYIPRSTSYYCYTKERALIYAVEVDKNIPIDFEDDVIYSRFYSNAYFQGLQGVQDEQKVECRGFDLTHSSHILLAQQACREYRDKDGVVTFYCNGFIIDDVGPLTVQIGDTLELVYDSSVKRVLRYNASDLPVFFSERDGKNKYLLHHLCEAMDTIEYQDDIEVNILVPNKFGRYKGLYYHRNNPENHRMVTHRDYSITVDHFQYVSSQLERLLQTGPLAIEDLEVLVHIRHSGYHRPLVYDSSRIFELYKLPHDKILGAMIGVNSTLALWKASSLENSDYVKLMDVERREINESLVERALGYNSISKVLGDTPVRPKERGPYVVTDLHPSQYKNSTLYEYDASGYLIGWNTHKTGMDYVSSSNEVKLLEVYVGRGSHELSQVFGENYLAIPTNCSYRVYMCYMIDGVPNNEWRDITGSELYKVEDNILIWENLETDQYLMVRTDERFLSYSFELERHLGQLSFEITEVREVEGEKIPVPMQVPMGQLDIFLNGRSLIRGLDYMLEFPRVTILNKDYLVEGKQSICVRFNAFANSDLSLDHLEDKGFVSHGLLSSNNRFDIRDDKVMRITVNGSLVTKDDVLFAEEHSGISIVNSVNGQPYQIKDIIVPFRGISNMDTYELRAIAQATDEAVENYMSLYLPEPEREHVDAIQRLYPLVSPFARGLLDAMQSGILDYDRLSNTTTDQQVLELCRPYEYLLEIDPINTELGFDFNYVIVHPHEYASTVELRFHQYRVLLRAMHLYTDGRIDVSSFFTFSVE